MIKNSIRNKIILAAIGVAVFFVFTELFLRIFNFKFDLNDYIMRFDKMLQVDVQISDGSFLKDPVLFWTKSPESGFEINSFGFRDSRESMKKDEDSFRIICLGGSVTYGAPADLIKLKATYPKQLELILNSRFPGKRFDVINAGVPGYTSYQGLKYLKTKIIKYDPDLIIVLFGHNDAAPAVYFEDKQQVSQQVWLLKIQNALIKSRFYQILSKVIFIFRYNFSQFRTPLNHEKMRVSSVDYTNNLKLMFKIAESNHFQSLFLPPLIYQNDAVFYLDCYGLPENVFMVDYLHRFQQEKNKRALFLNDNCHFSALGHRILAEEIADFLIKNNLLNAEK